MRLLLALFLVSFLYNTQAQQQAVLHKVDSVKKQKSNVPLKLDQSKTDVHHFNDRALDNYKEKKEFHYDDDAPKTTSAWDRFWASFWNWFRALFRSEKNPQQNTLFAAVLKYSLIGLSAALIIFVIFKLLNVDFKLLFGKSKVVDVPYDESLENIHEINFDEQLETALENNNYRLGVRLLYLQTLKQLTDKELIDWRPEKTNNIYVAELESQSLHADFSSLTYQFEFIWYGDFPIDQTQFARLKQSFQNFNQATR